MSDWDIKYVKKHQTRSAELGKEMFAIGYNGKGRAEAFMYMSDEQITILWGMAHEMNSGGKTPREALEIMEGRIAESKAKIAARRLEAEASKS